MCTETYYDKLQITLNYFFVSVHRIMLQWFRIRWHHRSIYKYLDTGLLFPSIAICDPVKLTSPALTHARQPNLSSIYRSVASRGIGLYARNSRTKLPLAGELTYGKCSFRWHIRRILHIIFTYATKFRHSKLIFTSYLQIILQKYRVILI